MYSNNETSPNGDQSSMDESARKLPPLTASAALNGGFKCDHAGCTAPPFQTQYLLKCVIFMPPLLIITAKSL